MPDNVRMWVEIGFNLIYLIVIWWLVISMTIKRSLVPLEFGRQSELVIWAFGLLAIGDTGHVGFRVLAFILGGLESSLPIMGLQISLVGLGALMTAITVTFFYILMLETWRVRFKKQYSWFEIIILLAATLRLLLMVFPANKWYSVVPPQPWSLIRNIPLTFMGLSIAFLILRDAMKAKDQTFTWIGIMILLSYACYLPVILFVQQVPIIGMLMIPKTLAYVAIGFLAYYDLYPSNQKQTLQIEEQTTN